ncbi:Protein of unknown function [Paenibacillaceae bacterium GAS479]|nr:Protein of unknown function [Paenibacillaceae bacterium GAS479]
MIVRKTEQAFILIHQHDHAALSEQLARSLAPELLPEGARRAEIIYAASQHDRGWISLDETPIWNDATGMPFTFEDYPLLPKIAFYKRGIDEVEAVSPYAGLLCSLFYSAFFVHMEGEACEEFLRREEIRQHRLKMNLRTEQQELDRDLKLLQLLDSLSLYVCLNEPGAVGENEHPWYREGFPGTEGLMPSGRKLRASWQTKQRLLLSEKALQGPVDTTLRFKRVPMSLIEDRGIDIAYRESPMDTAELVWDSSC